MFPEITRDDVFRLETRRLWLRWPHLTDAAALTAIAGRPEVAETTVHVPHPYPMGEACRQIDQWRSRNAEGRGLTLVLTGQGPDRVPFGLVSLEPTSLDAAVPFRPGEQAVKLGLLIDPSRWGQGYATEAVQAIADTAFVLTAARCIEVGVRVVNPAARRVVERCGFVYEATVLRSAPARGGMVSCDCFRLDRKTWASLKQWRMPIAGPPYAAGYGPRRPADPKRRVDE